MRSFGPTSRRAAKRLRAWDKRGYNRDRALVLQLEWRSFLRNAEDQPECADAQVR